MLKDSASRGKIVSSVDCLDRKYLKTISENYCTSVYLSIKQYGCDSTELSAAIEEAEL